MCKMSVAPVSGYGLDKAGSWTVSSSAISLLFLVGLIVTYWSKNKNIPKSVVLSWDFLNSADADLTL